MFLIIKTLDWTEEDFIQNNIVPFGWCEDDRALSKNKEIVAKVETMEQVRFVVDKLNNKYVRRIK